MTTKNAFIAIVAIMIIVLGVALFKQRATTGNEPVRGGKMSLVPYQSTAYAFGFEYPSGYYLKERTDVGTPTQPQLAVVLVDNSEQNRNLVEGRMMEPHEGPTMITVDAYQNPTQLTAQQWVDQSTNWTVKSNISTVPVGDTDGVSFTWDGLYAGKSVVVSVNGFVYVFGVTWITEDDQILKDFDMVLNSATFNK